MINSSPIIESLHAVISGAPFESAREAAALQEIFEGKVPQTQVAAWLAALAIKGETSELLVALVSVMRGHAKPFFVSSQNGNSTPLIDTCGTGGDNSGSFNVSTAAGLIASAAGGRVVKHGNRSASSRCGSADILEAAGFCIDTPVELAVQSLEKFGFTFLFARAYHSAMRHVGSIRAELGFRTVFNLLGPLSNPAKVKRQLLGVFSSRWVRPLAETLRDMGHERALVIYGDGLDEIAIDSPTFGYEVRNGLIHEMIIDPANLPVQQAPRSELTGGDPATNVKILNEVLSGGPSPAAEISILNAGAVLWLSDLASDLKEGINIARSTVISRKAQEHFFALLDFHKQIGKA